jgi:AmpE protein
MEFLTIMAVVLVYRNWFGGNPVRDAFSTESWFSAIRGNISAGNLRFIAAVIVPAVAILILSDVIHSWFFGLLNLALSIAILLFAIEVIDLDVLIEDHRVWAAEQQQDGDFFTDITYEVFQCIVPVLFWFLILGPAGVVLYALSERYLAQLGEDDSDISLVEQLIYWMEWIPARVTGLIYALLGDFRGGLDALSDVFADTQNSNALVLGNTVRASMTSNNPDDEFLDLQWLLENSIWGWVAIAALLTILGW